MNTSASITKIAPALLLAQKAIGYAEKSSSNPFFHSKYADLGAVMEACKDELNKNGISVLQPVGTDEVGVYVETVLLHESGEYIADKMRISVKQANDPQAQGSAITYARRYGLQSMLFIPAEDDDGETAMARVEKPAQVTTGPTNGCLHDGERIEKVAGAGSTRPGQKFEICRECGVFLKWIKEETK